MRKLLCQTVRAVLFCFLAVTLSAAAQDNQQQSRPAPDNHAQRPPQQGGQKPGTKPRTKPAPGNGQRPQPSKPGTRPPQQPSRPGTRPPQQPSRPTPGRPTPGRPTPVRPTPGKPTPRPPAHRPPAHRPPQWGRPPAQRPVYNWRPNDRAYLHRYYLSRLARINRARRPRIIIGGYFPYADITYLSPLPPDLYGYLPPPPPGYQMGYYDGYVVVYDPVTYFIVNVIDLLQ